MDLSDEAQRDAVREHLGDLLRGRRLLCGIGPLAGLAEVQEATRAVLCDGDDRAASLVTADLVVGEALGSVDEAVPMVPLEADLVATCRRLRVRREPKPRVLELDLRKPGDQARSQLFHRLQLLDIGWVTPAESEVVNQGTFRETWSAAWQLELGGEPRAWPGAPELG